MRIDLLFEDVPRDLCVDFAIVRRVGREKTSDSHAKGKGDEEQQHVYEDSVSFATLPASPRAFVLFTH